MRHIDTATRSLVAIGALVGSLTLTGVALAGRGGSSAPVAAVSHRHELVEDPRCGDRRRHPPTTTSPSLTAGTPQTIRVTVPAVAMVRLDRRGRPTWARTNTGCAPSAPDLVYLVQRNGTLVQAPEFDVSSIDWHGDFRDGRQAQQDD